MVIVTRPKLECDSSPKLEYFATGYIIGSWYAFERRDTGRMRLFVGVEEGICMHSWEERPVRWGNGFVDWSWMTVDVKAMPDNNDLRNDIFDDGIQRLWRYRRRISTCYPSTISLQSLNSVVDIASSTISLRKSLTFVRLDGQRESSENEHAFRSVHIFLFLSCCCM